MGTRTGKHILTILLILLVQEGPVAGTGNQYHLFRHSLALADGIRTGSHAIRQGRAGSHRAGSTTIHPVKGGTHTMPRATGHIPHHQRGVTSHRTSAQPGSHTVHTTGRTNHPHHVPTTRHSGATRPSTQQHPAGHHDQSAPDRLPLFRNSATRLDIHSGHHAVFDRATAFICRLASKATDEHDPAVLLAVNASRHTLLQAQALHLQPRPRLLLRHLGITVTPLHIPNGADATVVLHQLRRCQTGTILLNHYYRLASIERREPDGSNYPTGLINWPASCVVCGFGIRIGMIDSHINTAIPPLQGSRIITKSFTTVTKGSATDHGTAIATVLVGKEYKNFCGLLPEATLLAAEAFGGQPGREARATVLAIVRSLDWLLGRHVQVINLSFSGPDNALLRQATHQIIANNIPVIAAAGNYGRHGPPAYPAAYADVIAVTAIDRFRRPYPYANQGDYISFAAPGVRVRLPCGQEQFCYRSGTSFAVPYCTALVADQLYRDERITSIMHYLRANSEDLGFPGKDPVFGWGLVRRGATWYRERP